MRFLIGLVIASAVLPRAHAAAPARPILLSYGEVMALPSADRIAYLKDVGELLALMEEKFTDRYLVASNGERARPQVTALLQLLQLMPDADAAPNAPAQSDYNSFKPQWTGKEFSCGNDPRVVFDARVVTCALQAPKLGDMRSSEWKGKCPEGAHEVKSGRVFSYITGTSFCVPKASWDALSEPAKRKLGEGRLFDKDKFAAMKNADKGALVGVPIPDEPQGVSAVGEEGAQAPRPGLAAVPASCETPKVGTPEYNKMVTDFRKDPEAKTCIAGGFFTKKKQQDGNFNKAACPKVRVFPEHKIDEKDPQISCEANTVLCNPAVFCLQIKNYSYKDRQGKPGKSTILQSICVKDTPMLTRDCAQGYADRLAGKAKVQVKKGQESARGKRPEACDPATVDIPFLKGRFMNDFIALKTETENQYVAHCTGNDKTFLPLFCEECKIIGARLAKMRQPAANSEAGSTGTPAPAGGADATK